VNQGKARKKALRILGVQEGKNDGYKTEPAGGGKLWFGSTTGGNKVERFKKTLSLRKTMIPCEGG